MTSNVPKNKICDGFLILRSFLKMKHSTSYFQLKLSSQIYISGNWSTFWNRILSENCAFLWNRKMAERTPENILFFCSAGHVGSETVSTDRYKIMCRMHVPVYLFPDARDEMFLTYHYHVGIYKFIFVNDDILSVGIN